MQCLPTVAVQIRNQTGRMQIRHPTPPMTATLYDLTGDALRLQQQIDAAAGDLFSDDPAEVAAATEALESLISAESDNRRQVEAKADAWCWVIDQLRATAEARKCRALALSELAKTAEHRADQLQDRLVQALQKVDPDSTKWDLPNHRLTSRRTTSVELVYGVDELPEQFQRIKTSLTADKTALAAALKAGEQIDGATLVERRSWKIA